MEQGFYFTGINKEEFKNILRETLREILHEGRERVGRTLPDILDIRQAAEFIKVKITTLYEKTSSKSIPHFKKGNKLYFKREELEQWLNEGKVKTIQEVQNEAITYSMNKRKRDA